MIDTQKIFGIATDRDFEETALEVFRHQATHCAPYRRYLSLLGVSPASIDSVDRIPFLPIVFFKTHDIYSSVRPPEMVFTSSGTTGQVPSRHLVASLKLYEESFTRGFRLFYGSPREYAIFALLPNYLERSGSSLVCMADSLIRQAGEGGFFLYEHDRLIDRMKRAEDSGKKILLLGVSFALWELAEKYRLDHPGMIVMETGGMKGRREEITREKLHSILCESFGVDRIHSEYGMTELLSQGYSSGNGVFHTPPWMKISVRDIHDPFRRLPPGKTGGIDVIDLANLHSCSFIETQDMGAVHPDGGFSIAGRIDRSEIRGCNLMVSDL